MPDSRENPFERLGRPSLTKELKIKQAMDVLKERGVKHDFCPRCEHLDWQIDIIEIRAESYLARLTALTPPPFREGGFSPFSPSKKPDSGLIFLMAIVCRNCGYTMFHNLNTLGVQVR